LAGSPLPVEGTDAAVTSATLLTQAQTIGGKLATSKILPDEPVIWVTANRPADLAAMLGIWLAGGVAVPLHADAAPSTAQGVQHAVGGRFHVNGGRIETIADTPPPARELLRGAALILFTSGSTGKPKGAVIGHDRLARKLEVLDRLLALSAQDRVVVPLQLTF